MEEKTVNKSLCSRKGKYGEFTCGFCMTAKAIANGTQFIVDGRIMPKEEAIQYNLALCTQAVKKTEERTTVKEIRREGQRILKAGTNIRVQLKRKAGTHKSDGHIVECYEDNFVKIFVNDLNAFKVLPADEFIVGRRGITKAS